MEEVNQVEFVDWVQNRFRNSTYVVFHEDGTREEQRNFPVNTCVVSLDIHPSMDKGETFLTHSKEKLYKMIPSNYDLTASQVVIHITPELVLITSNAEFPDWMTDH